MGAAGDMLSAALLELLPQEKRAGFVERLNGLGIPGVEYRAERVQRAGVSGTHLTVLVRGEAEGREAHEEHHAHAHRTMAEIEEIVSSLELPDEVQCEVMEVYRRIAEAEGEVHGCPAGEVHFHEVGAMDAIADVAAVCLLFHTLAPAQVVCSPIAVGSGTVRCAHGILPVPAPATALLLRGLPICSGDFSGELCTPTGAALLAHFVTSFGEMPPMGVSAIGYGCGTKEFPRANVVRALLGETLDQAMGGRRQELSPRPKGELAVSQTSLEQKRQAPAPAEPDEVGPAERVQSGAIDDPAEVVCELCANIDDMTGEELGFAQERIFAVGAVEVWLQQVTMKKMRPAVVLHVLCRPRDHERVLRAILENTQTLGVRESVLRRYVLERSVHTAHTSLGTVTVKVSEGYGVRRVKAEYEDLARIAREKGMSLRAVREQVERELHREK